MLNETVLTSVSYTHLDVYKRQVLGDAQEHETANTFAVSLTMSQIVVEDDQFFVEVMEALETQDVYKRQLQPLQRICSRFAR